MRNAKYDLRNFRSVHVAKSLHRIYEVWRRRVVVMERKLGDPTVEAEASIHGRNSDYALSSLVTMPRERKGLSDGIIEKNDQYGHRESFHIRCQCCKAHGFTEKSQLFEQCGESYGGRDL